MLFFQWPPAGSVSISGNSTEAKQDAQIVLETATNTKLDTLHTDLTNVETKQDAGNTSLASIDGKVATAANQTTANTSLSSIDTKLSSVATSANQTTANTSLSSIDTKLSSQATAANQTTANTSLASIDTKVATAANQTTANTSLSSIDTKLSSQATAANQTTANTSLSSIDTKLGGTLTVAQAGKTCVARARLDYSSTNVTTSAYVQLLASVGATAVKEIEIFDSSGNTMVLATGAAASEIDQVYVMPGGNGRIPLSIGVSTRVAVKAVSASATSGEITINFYS